MTALKYSRQRECIMTNLQGRKDHPTAEMIYHDIREKYPHISLGTVYRNLALLTELGEIQKVTAVIGPDRYDGNPLQHHHFTCVKCGKVEDLPDAPTDQLLKQVAAHFDGKIEGCVVAFTGLCAQCKESESGIDESEGTC